MFLNPEIIGVFPHEIAYTFARIGHSANVTRRTKSINRVHVAFGARCAVHFCLVGSKWGGYTVLGQTSKP